MYQINFKQPCHIYFVGIGGISMSGLAELLKTANFIVSGSDIKSSSITQQLEEKEITIYYSQNGTHITKDIDCVIFTSAIQSHNPEYIATVNANIPYLTRAQLLGQIMQHYEIPICISGTHGKTTTTSMLAEILLASEEDPTLSIGGILPSIGGNIRIGDTKLFVTEACEYTNSFLSFFPKISIILNVEEDHMDFFKDLANIQDSFHSFAKLLPTDGTLIINNEIKNKEQIFSNLDCSYVTYGLTPDCDYYISNITNQSSGTPTFNLTTPDQKEYTIHMSVLGLHNITNGTSALALAHILGLPMEKAIMGLENFQGTKRRFEKKGMIGNITIIDDYAHHPTEISATLSAAQNIPHDTLWCIFQPHTYTRTKAFLSDFASSLSQADVIILTDIYPARETDTLGMHSCLLKNELEKLGKTCYYFNNFSDIEIFLLQHCMNNDLLITMGAGDVVQIAENLLGN